VYEYIAKRDRLNTNNTFKPEQVKIPARMEIISLKDLTTIIIDGAHNKQKVEAFVLSFIQQYPNSKAAVSYLLLKTEKSIRILWVC
jgi:folylpolyglutamate synthase/dihydropteroate synthase